MSRVLRSTPSPLALAVTLLALGCGSAPRRGTIEGVVLLNGEPLPGGVLLLRIPTPRGPETATLDIAADGRFRAVDLPPGKADVAITTETLKSPTGNPPPSPDGPAVRRYVAVPARYHSFKTSNLSLEIGTGTTSATIELKLP